MSSRILQTELMPIETRLTADHDLEPLEVDDAHDARARSLFRTEHYDLSRGVAACVLRTALRTPDARAVVDGRRSLTYRQLARELVVLARQLREEGVKPGEVVPVCCKRSADTIIALLATQHCAAVYLPVPEDWPKDRTNRALAECGARVVLTERAPAAAADTTRSPRFVAISRTPSADSAPPLDPRNELGDPESPAYIVYTSGSTGVPKGAVVERRGLMNHLACKVQDLRLSSRDVVAQTAAVAFDISIWQMLAALLVGGQVHVIDDETANAPAALLDAVARHGITVLELVPTVLRQVLEESRRTPAPSPLRGLNWMLATGEVLPPALARSWNEAHPRIPLLNAYGPTECSDDVTHHVVSAADNDVSVPIGKPVANTALYVLRSSGASWQACAPGEVGELFVGGAGVGRGYLGDPAKTRRAFFRDTLAGHGRIYRTGDLVRRRPDGVLEYRGRVDRQVKIRGIRVELEEIEAAIREHPAVAGCAVLAKELRSRRLVARDSVASHCESGNRTILAAYLCLRSPLPAPELRTFLIERIPAKIVPDRYLVLATLPLTTNRKVDLAALPDPDEVRPELTATYEPPASPLERAIAAAWADALQIERVGRQDRFLDLGGDSLVAMQIVAELRQTLGCALTFAELLLAETPVKLAEILEGRPDLRHLDRDARARDGSSSTRPERMPLSVYQEGVYFQWCLAPQNPYYTYQGVLRIVGPEDRARLTAAWDALLAENPTLRSRFQDEQGEAYQQPGAWPCPLGEPLDMRGDSPQERDATFRAIAHAEAQVPFDLASRPPLRAMLIHFADGEFRILVTMHEILLDGWGAMVLLSRLAELYAATPGRSLADFGDYVHWESAHLREQRVQDAARYWASELSGPLPVLALPMDRPRPRVPSYRGRIVQYELPDDLARALDAACARSGATRFMVLLAAFGVVLAYYGNADEVVVGVPISNRDSPEQAKVAAFLLNMLPVRLRPHRDRTCAGYVDDVREKVVRAFAVADYPFSWMLRSLTELSRTINQTPVFQVMLNVLNYPPQRLAVSGVAFEFTELETGFTKYDCSLYAQPHGADSLLLQLAYQTDLFDEVTASRLLESVTYAIRALGEDPDARLGEVELLPAEDAVVLQPASVSAGDTP